MTMVCIGHPLSEDRPLSGSAEFFVAMCTLTMLYCLVILPVYVCVFVYTPKQDYSKYVVILVSMTLSPLLHI